MIFPPLTNIFSKNPELSSGWLRNPASPWMVETHWNPINNGMFTTYQPYHWDKFLPLKVQGKIFSSLNLSALSAMTGPWWGHTWSHWTSWLPNFLEPQKPWDKHHLQDPAKSVRSIGDSCFVYVYIYILYDRNGETHVITTERTSSSPSVD